MILRFPLLKLFPNALACRVLQSLHYLLLAAAGACLWLGSCDAQAASLQISPVSIAFQPGQGAAGINLQNGGDAPLYGQVRVYSWDQKDGIDMLTPATDLVASPPIIEVAANSTQTIRLVRRNPGADPGADGRERSYRILIDEIPRNETGGGVAIRLQYSVPVWVAPGAPSAAPAVAFSLVRRNGELLLRAENKGALHAQFGATRVRAGAGEIEISKGLLGYALAGRTREWPLPKDKAAKLDGPLTVVATVNAREASFPLAPPAN